MIIFEVPSNGGQGGIRVASLGSCRVRAPISALADRGDLRICEKNLVRTHTAAEALQEIDLIMGEKSIPEFLWPFVFSRGETSKHQLLASLLRKRVGVFILEISGDRQFSFADVVLQAHLLSINLVQAHRKALLEWFRNVCDGREVDDACVRAALDGLRREGLDVDARTGELLRGIRLERQTGEAIESVLGAMIAKLGGHWIIVGHFVVPGLEGAVMADRRALNDKSRRAAAIHGAQFYDPSELIAEHGRAIALDAEGAHIFHYAPEFNPTVGEKLVALVRQCQPAAGPGARATIVLDHSPSAGRQRSDRNDGPSPKT
jgi:hypothetical protein